MLPEIYKCDDEYELLHLFLGPYFELIADNGHLSMPSGWVSDIDATIVCCVRVRCTPRSIPIDVFLVALFSLCFAVCLHHFRKLKWYLLFNFLTFILWLNYAFRCARHGCHQQRQTITIGLCAVHWPPKHSSCASFWRKSIRAKRKIYVSRLTSRQPNMNCRHWPFPIG